MQRDVEFEVEAIDKSGGFIGALYINKTDNAAIALVREGLASIHPPSADGLSWAKQLYEAEVRRYVWFWGLFDDWMLVRLRLRVLTAG